LQAFKGEICFSKRKISGRGFQLKSAFGKKYGETIDDRVAAGTSGTEDSRGFEAQRRVADRTDEVEKVLLSEHVARVERLRRRSWILRHGLNSSVCVGY
jgi:hypothetical protein